MKRLLSKNYIKENFQRIPFLLIREFFLNPFFEIYFRGLAGKKNLQYFKIVNRANLHHGQDIFVLGNGPSLSGVNLDALEGKVTLASNKIFLTFENTKWRPTYYTVEDDLVLKQNFEKIREVKSVKLMPSVSLYYGKHMQDAEYFKFRQWHHFPAHPNFGLDPVGGFYWGSSVVYTQIQLAKYLGAKRIVLLGVDFSFSVPKSAAHSSKEIISEGEQNHFHKDYRLPGERWNLPNLEKQALAFEAARVACMADGIEILNATRGTKLKVFKCIDIADVL